MKKTWTDSERGARGASALPVTRYERVEDGVLLHTGPGTMKLQVCGERIFRVFYTPTDSFPHRESLMLSKTSSPPVAWELEEDQGLVAITTENIQARVDLETTAVGFFSKDGDLVLQEKPEGGKGMTPAEVVGEPTYHAEQIFSIQESEGFYGLGQHRLGQLNYSGRTIVLRQWNQVIGTPMLVSSRGYGILWDNYSLAKADFGNEIAGQWSIQSEVADAIDYYFIYGPEIDEVIAGYRQLTGSAPLLGKWAYGYWQCKNRYKTQEEVLEVCREFRDRNIPIDIIIQDWQYWGKYPWNSFRFDEANYPDPREMIRIVHEEYNLHFMLSVWSRFGESKQGRESTIYNEMQANGYLFDSYLYPIAFDRAYMYGEWLRKVVTSPYFDPFDEGARKLYWDQMKEAFFDIGVDGWWLDCTEPEIEVDPMGFRNYRTAIGTGARYFNAYSLMLTKGVYEGQRETTSDQRVCILTRSAYAGQQRHAAVSWSGDIPGTWDELQRQIPAGMNFSVSGLPYWTSDIGGFSAQDGESDDYRELFIRWFQFGAFCPVFRTHGSQVAREPWQFGEAAEGILVEFDRLRYRLLPYIYSLAWKVTSEEYTIMRPLVMDFRADPDILDVADQFMFGPAMMVSPVTEPGANSRQVTLPRGADWFDFWTGRRFSGGQVIDAPAPIDRIPLYVRAGSILPMGPLVQYAMEKPADPIELRVYRGADASIEIYEDEGDSYNYENGVYATIPIRWEEAREVLTIGDREGSFPGMLKERTFHVVMVREGHGVGVDATVEHDQAVAYAGAEKGVR